MSLYKEIEATALSRLHRTAVRQGSQSLSYGELIERSTAVASYLAERMIGSGDIVAVWMDRDVTWPIALLGILQAGAAYLPLDIDNPPSRVEYVLRDAGVSFMFSEKALLASGMLPVASIKEAMGNDGESVPETSGGLAYVIYTSGSSGLPKGVAVGHESLLHTLKAVAHRYELTEQDNVLQFSALAFDVAAEELFATLISGGTVVLRDPGPPPGIGELVALVRREAISVLNLPASYWHEWVSLLSQYSPESCSELRLIVVGSEAVDAERLATWQRQVPPRIRWLNAYGLTETTITSIVFEPPVTGVPLPGKTVPIGHELPGVRAYVLDTKLRPVPPGVEGDLYIGGAGLAVGYLNDPARTEASFLPDPSAEPGARMFASRDRVRRSVDGVLEFVTRSDEQIKVRGFRVEPAEIENVLRSHPAVADAVVVLREYQPGDWRLTGYITTVGDVNEESLLDDLWRESRVRLPGHMVPAHLLSLPTLPRLLSGKVDRKALPLPVVGRRQRDRGGRQRGTAEHRMTNIWADVLSVPVIRGDDNFFQLGGHSLLAAQVLARISNEFGVELSMRDLFEHPTVAQLTRLVLRATSATTRVRAVPTTASERPALLPLSFAQQRMWFMDQLVTDGAVLNVGEAIRLSGVIEEDVLRQALGLVVERHEVLRTYYPASNGMAQQQVAASTVLDWEVTTAEDLGQARQIVVDGIRRRFDLETGPVMRAGIVRISAAERVLWMAVHHIAYDEWSNGVLLHDLSRCYRKLIQGQLPDFQPLRAQYGDFTLWQRGNVDSSAREQQLTYWRKQLAGAPQLLTLPLDHDRPTRQSRRGSTVLFQFDADLMHGVKSLAAAQAATPFMVLIAVFGVLLKRYGTGPDIPVATPVAGRDRQELEQTVGLFFNVLVLRLDLTGEPHFTETLHRIRETVLGAFDHQELPFEHLVEVLRPPRNSSHDPLAQVLFQLHARRPNSLGLDIPGAAAESFSFPWSTVRSDLEWHLREVDDSITGIVAYATDLFESSTIEAMVDDYKALLRAALANPEQSLSSVPLSRASHNPRDDAGDTKSSPGISDTPMMTSGELREEMCQLWSTVLGREVVGIEDDFFELGGQSLLALQLLARIREVFEVRISLIDLFDTPTVGEISDLVAEAKGIVTSKEVRTPK